VNVWAAGSYSHCPVDDVAAERAEAGDVLEVVPGDAADRIGRDQPRHDDAH
jgi:hypothetical protein